METDVTYLNGTRGADGGGERRREPAKGPGNPIHPDARVEGRKTPYTPTQTRPTALPDRDPNLPHVSLTLGGLKGRRNVVPRATETHFCHGPTPRLPKPSSLPPPFSLCPLPRPINRHAAFIVEQVDFSLIDDTAIFAALKLSEVSCLLSEVRMFISNYLDNERELVTESSDQH